MIATHYHDTRLHMCMNTEKENMSKMLCLLLTLLTKASIRVYEALPHSDMIVCILSSHRPVNNGSCRYCND